jgi:plastocyanin
MLTPAAALGSAREAGTHTVVLARVKFNPSSLMVKRGGRVTFVWRDASIPHNVIISGLRGSSTQTSGSFTVRFTRRGSYTFRCSIHPEMVGRITVR